MSLQDLSNLGFGGQGQNANPGLAKVLAELQGLTFNLVTGEDAETEITITGMEAEDTLKAVLNLTDLTELDIADFTVGDRRASGTLTIATTLEDQDEVEVNGKTYTFEEVDSYSDITYNAAPQVIPIVVGPSGVDIAVVAARLAKVLMSSDVNLECTSDDGVVTIIWRVAGTVGNSKTLVVTGSGGHVTRSGATLTGGATTNGIVGANSTATKKLLVIWYNKTP